MRWNVVRHRNVGAALCTAVLILTGLWPVSASAAGHTLRGQTLITINGGRSGAVFDGIGAISGGGGNSRYLIDYPPAQQRQILNFLFGPGGADLQMLKLEIGGDANSSDGSEPSIEHAQAKGQAQPDCQSGYEWWLAEQALARNPRIKLYGLQWAAPGWVGSIWSQADVGYVIDWLNCAKAHNLPVSYIGGWNEHGYNAQWFTWMRAALNANGYKSVQIVAADQHPFGKHYNPASAWTVANAAAADPALKAAIGILGAHDTCGAPTNGYHCEATATARGLGRPLWESELGAMDGNTGAADMARSINNGYIQAGITGYVEWPLADSMPPGLPFENRGLVTADQPKSGNYHVNRITWAIAQTTQFTEPDWRHVTGANSRIGNSGTYNSYESPDKADWTLVAENTGSSSGQRVSAQAIKVRLTGGLKARDVQVWDTNLWSSSPRTWFVHRPDIRPKAGTFTYSVRPGYVVTFTSMAHHSHLRTTPPAPAAMKLPYQATRDASNEAWGLSSQDGAFLYQPCLAGVTGKCLEQLAPRQPVWWQAPKSGTPTPYAIVGDSRWSNYTVSASTLFTNPAGTASLIGRFGTQGAARNLFTGYEFDLQATGGWQLIRKSATASAPHVLARGTIADFRPGVWHKLALSLRGSRISATVDGTRLALKSDAKYKSGLAGIGSSWDLVQFSDLRVS